MDDGSEQPIAFASKSLTPAVKRYSQLDKEALAITHEVKTFHQYLFGRSFTIYSDHKLLTHLFGETRQLPQMASVGIQRWALTLSAHSYSIAYKPGKDHSNADAFSRLPLPEHHTEVQLPGETVLLMEHLQTTPVTESQTGPGQVRIPPCPGLGPYSNMDGTQPEEKKPYAHTFNRRMN